MELNTPAWQNQIKAPHHVKWGRFPRNHLRHLLKIQILQPYPRPTKVSVFKRIRQLSWCHQMNWTHGDLNENGLNI